MEKIWMWLCTGKDPYRDAAALLAFYGSLEEAFANGQQLDKSLLTPKRRAQLGERARPGFLEEQQENWTRQGIGWITLGGAYPRLLKTIPEAPALLFYRGNRSLLFEEKTVAVVGCRRCTRSGWDNTFRLAKEMAAGGVTVVSGMARGLDAAAHEGALEADGRTVAVLGTGIDVAYPPENGDLYGRILEKGCILSEYPPGMPPLPHQFPRRNRIIAGLSRGVLVTEGEEKSGAGITARLALEYDRDVFAMPGDISLPQSRLPNLFLQEGAYPVLQGGDVLAWYGWGKRSPRKAEKRLTGLEGRLYAELRLGPLTAEKLEETLALTPGAASLALLQMELAGHVRRGPGGVYEALSPRE